MKTVDLNYDVVKEWAIAHCKLKQAFKGDKFATAAELENIVSDIFGWEELWLLDFCDAIMVNYWASYADHNKKTFTLDYYPQMADNGK